MPVNTSTCNSNVRPTESDNDDDDNDTDTLRKVQHLSMKAWPYKQECRGHDAEKKNLLR